MTQLDFGFVAGRMAAVLSAVIMIPIMVLALYWVYAGIVGMFILTMPLNYSTGMMVLWLARFAVGVVAAFLFFVMFTVGRDYCVKAPGRMVLIIFLGTVLSLVAGATLWGLNSLVSSLFPGAA